jgi:hypothetical protein
MYDPPPDRLLEYAEHGDENAALLMQRTFSEDGDARERAGIYKAAVLSGDFHKLQNYADTLRNSLYESEAPVPPRAAHKPKLDELEAVQAAIWQRQGLTHIESAQRGGWDSVEASWDPRKRKNRNIYRVKQGKLILRSRKYSD